MSGLNKFHVDAVLGQALLKSLLFVRKINPQKKKKVAHPNRILVLKILGGGTLLNAMPSLRAIKKRHPEARFSIICSKKIEEYATATCLFDEIFLIESPIKMLFQLFAAYDVLLDLEIKSYLTSVFSLLSRSRLKIGYCLTQVRWQSGAYHQTILVGSNDNIPEKYDWLAECFQAEEHIKKEASFLTTDGAVPLEKYICVGVGGSNFLRERKMDPKVWCKVLKEIKKYEANIKIYFLGDRDDFSCAQSVVDQISPTMNCRNFCGHLSLAESLGVLRHSYAYIGIDSGLMHAARLMDRPSIGFWGPTKPEIHLRKMDLKEIHFYTNYACSPCATQKLSGSLPCLGVNNCMDHRLNLTQVSEFLGSLFGKTPLETSSQSSTKPLSFEKTEL